jgi:hypothetical protein
MISKFLDSKVGRVLISLILGFGLATIFKKVCKDNNCVLIQGPKLSEVNQYYYKIDENCYKYVPYASECKKK